MLADSSIARGMIARVAPQADRDLQMLERAAQASRSGKPISAIAYCFCGF